MDITPPKTNNYYLYGLTTADTMGSKYAEDPEWSRKVNSYIEKIKKENRNVFP